MSTKKNKDIPDMNDIPEQVPSGPEPVPVASPEPVPVEQPKPQERPVQQPRDSYDQRGRGGYNRRYNDRRHPQEEPRFTKTPLLLRFWIYSNTRIKRFW
jgi:hypothetical protein